MDDNKMTYEESIHKMLEQLLKNQMALLGGLGAPRVDLLKVAAELIDETDALLEQVKA